MITLLCYSLRCFCNFKGLLLLIIVASPKVSSADCGSYSLKFLDEARIFKIDDYTLLLTGIKRSKTKNGLIAIHDSFEGNIDRHISVKYKLISIKNNKAKVEYNQKSDARSFGGKLENCFGEWEIDVASLFINASRAEILVSNYVQANSIDLSNHTWLSTKLIVLESIQNTLPKQFSSYVWNIKYIFKPAKQELATAGKSLGFWVDAHSENVFFKEESD